MSIGKRIRRPGAFMRTDDKVGFGLRRRRVGYFVAAAIVVFTISLAFVIVGLDSRTQLSQDEVVQIRAYLAEARQRRDAEKEQTQNQLDTQAKALCDVLVGFEDLDDPTDSARVKAAEVKLGCARLVFQGGGPTASASPTSQEPRVP